MKLPDKKRVFLAPMEEVNDIAFRLLSKDAGGMLTWSQLTSPLDPREQILDDKPILQIFGNSTKGIKEFMKKYDSEVSGWDFNLGCPSTMAKNQQHGSYLENIEIVEKIVKIMRANTKKPLSIKIRKSPRANKFLEIAEKYCDWIAIHPRTRKQGYSGKPDLKWARDFKKRSNIPVIYSGNINLKNYEKFLKEFDYLMIGREAIGHPEIFAKIYDNKKFKRSFKNYLLISEKYNLNFKNIKFQAMQFTKGERGSRRVREEIFKIKDLEGLKKTFEN